MFEAGLTKKLSLLRSTHSIRQRLDLSILQQADHAEKKDLSTAHDLQTLRTSCRPRSVQFTLVHHLLDFCIPDMRKKIITDLVQVTEYGGTIIIIGFNPYSLWSGLIRRTARHALWRQASYVPIHQITRQLTALGCIFVRHAYYLPLFPWKIPEVGTAATGICKILYAKYSFWGGYYVVTATVSRPESVQSFSTAFLSYPGFGTARLKPLAGQTADYQDSSRSR